jgi:hypothetical protein
MSEPDIKTCPHCNNDTVVKVPTNFVTLNRDVTEDKKKVGETTKEYIEENREVLKQMKEEVKGVEFK